MSNFFTSFLGSALLYVMALFTTTLGVLLGIQLRKNKIKKDNLR